MPYFDFNATAPLHEDARRAWMEVSDRAWHNPSGLAAASTTAREILDDCRDRLASILDCDPERIVFTSGATSAANLVAAHLARTAEPGSQAILSPLEHPCVAESFGFHFAGRVTELPVDAHGIVHVDAVADLLDTQGTTTAIVSVMAASNESGTIQPWRELADLCRSRDLGFHADAAQWLGKLPARGLGACDWVTGSGHKFGGPKGVGFLVIPAKDRGFRGDRGGPQEHGRHAGTEDVAGVAAMVAALEAHERSLAGLGDPRAAGRDAAERRLAELMPNAVVVGARGPRLWNTLAVALPGIDGRKVVARLDRAGIIASTGSACSSGAGSTARVLVAIGSTGLGLPTLDGVGMIRLSGGWETTADEWLAAVECLAAAVVDPGKELPRISFSSAP